MARILIIDDDRDFGQSLQSLLEDHQHHVQYVESATRAVALSHDPFDVVLLDNRMPGMTGIEFLKVLREKEIVIPIILMTNRGTSETVIEAINLGAFDYIEKPLEIHGLIDELEPLLLKALEFRPGKITRPTPPPDRSIPMLGNSKPMLELYKQIGLIAKTDLPVLIRGETGTGKELVAQAIHSFSPRKDKPFVALNCTALNENLLDDELFGHEEGAYSDAKKLRKGRFEYANQGTLFLDEVGDMPAVLQVKLLRVLEAKEVVRIGSNEPIKVDVRILSATHQDLESAVKAGRFREDLLFRLNGTTLCVPPLRDRETDVERLARHFLADEAAKANRPMPTLHETSLKLLKMYSWPGNVRELQFVMRRAVQKCRGLDILPEDLDLPRQGTDQEMESGPGAELKRIVHWGWNSAEPKLWPLLSGLLERHLIEHALVECRGNKREVARRLGVSPNYLLKRIRELGLE
jgi:DNA-binding NtrC family response regulator